MNKEHFAAKTAEYVETFWNYVKTLHFNISPDVLITDIHFGGHAKFGKKDFVALMVDVHNEPSILVPFGEWKPHSDSFDYMEYAFALYQAYVIISVTCIAPRFFSVISWDEFYLKLLE